MLKVEYLWSREDFTVALKESSLEERHVNMLHHRMLLPFGSTYKRATAWTSIELHKTMSVLVALQDIITYPDRDFVNRRINSRLEDEKQRALWHRDIDGHLESYSAFMLMPDLT